MDVQKVLERINWVLMAVAIINAIFQISIWLSLVGLVGVVALLVVKYISMRRENALWEERLAAISAQIEAFYWEDIRLFDGRTGKVPRDV